LVEVELDLDLGLGLDLEPGHRSVAHSARKGDPDAP
jgi:hypothetical protein